LLRKTHNQLHKLPPILGLRATTCSKAVKKWEKLFFFVFQGTMVALSWRGWAPSGQGSQCLGGEL